MPGFGSGGFAGNNASPPAQSGGGFSGAGAPAPTGPIEIRDSFMAPNVGVKTLIYGKAGIGKTVLCSTAPSPIILSAERGLLSLRKLHVPYIEVSTMAMLRAALTFLTSPQGQQFLTICLDSVSEIAEVVLAHELATNTNGQRAYGDMAKEILKLFRDCRDLPRHVVFTAQMGNYKDGQTGMVMYGPSFPGQQLDQKVPYMFDEMFQLLSFKDAQGADFRVLRTQPDNQNEAKDRSGVLSQWEYPDLNSIFNKIMGS
jgi:hypothetical protein